MTEAFSKSPLLVLCKQKNCWLTGLPVFFTNCSWGCSVELFGPYLLCSITKPGLTEVIKAALNPLSDMESSVIYVQYEASISLASQPNFRFLFTVSYFGENTNNQNCTITCISLVHLDLQERLGEMRCFVKHMRLIWKVERNGKKNKQMQCKQWTVLCTCWWQLAISLIEVRRHLKSFFLLWFSSLLRNVDLPCCRHILATGIEADMQECQLESDWFKLAFPQENSPVRTNQGSQVNVSCMTCPELTGSRGEWGAALYCVLVSSGRGPCASSVLQPAVLSVSNQSALGLWMLFAPEQGVRYSKCARRSTQLRVCCISTVRFGRPLQGQHPRLCTSTCLFPLCEFTEL